jgi:hypothetical protein
MASSTVPPPIRPIISLSISLYHTVLSVDYTTKVRGVKVSKIGDALTNHSFDVYTKVRQLIVGVRYECQSI